MHKSVGMLNKNDNLDEILKKAKKLVVLEFMKPDNEVYLYIQQEVEEIAKHTKDKAKFYAVDVNKFKKQAEEYGVEALPAFVLMRNTEVKAHILDTDELRKAIEKHGYNERSGEEGDDGHEDTNGSPNGKTKG